MTSKLFRKHKVQYQCKCGKLYSTYKLNTYSSNDGYIPCQQCGRDLSEQFIPPIRGCGVLSGYFIPSANFTKVLVYRKHWWSKWKVIEVIEEYGESI